MEKINSMSSLLERAMKEQEELKKTNNLLLS